jgi:phage tail sheath protein FI
MGRAAQRNVVVTSMQGAIAGNDEIRADSRFFNLLVAPGYPELLDEMITLSVDRKNTSFVLADTPMRLKPAGTSVQAWATNSNNATGNGEDGLVSASPYAAVYYPSGYSTDLSGNNVVVPATHIALRTLAFNDQVAYPWFAPAGFTRGLVGNSASVGYITSEGEFQAVTLSEGQRDTMYSNKVNPIAFIPNRGLVVFGQKTLSATASALDRINVARLIVYLRYHLDLIAKPYLFEPNDRITRDQVTDTFDRFLEDLTSKRALYDFLVVCDESNNTSTRIDKNELWIDIAIQPTKAVEFIYIPLRIKNAGESLTS